MDWLREILGWELIPIKDHPVTIGKILFLIGIFIAARLLVIIVQYTINRRFSNIKWVDKGKQFALVQLAKYLIYTFTLVLGLQSLGFDITILLAGSTALFVGLGLALQGAFKDIISGVFILFEGTVSVGDIMEVDGIVGEVKEINFRCTYIETRDGISILIPNAHFLNDRVINWSVNNQVTRFRVDVGVSYESDIEFVTQLLLEAASNHPKIKTSPPPRVQLTKFNTSSIDFCVFFWSESIWDVEVTRSDVRYRIYHLFKENRIKIPFPQQDIYIHNK
jgi:small-conductance mechanosensitive channel